MGLPSRAATAAALAVLGWTIPAGAHEEHALHALTVLRSVSPDIEGVEVRIVHLDAPALAVRNETDQLLTVLGAHGERFLEISSEGVRANAESPTTYLSAAPRAENVPAGLDPAGRPRWVTFSEEKAWTWFDPRLRAGDSDAWEVRLLLDGQPIVIDGGFESLHGHGHFVSELDTPEVEGLDLRLTQGSIPGVFVRNDTGRVLWVPGETGEPFLRIGPRGVFANLRSPTYYTSGGTSIQKVPPSADATAPPRWRQVSADPVWAWLERRGAVPAELYEREELGDRSHPVLEWSAPYRLGNEVIEVNGRVMWVPPAPSSPESDAVDGDAERWLLPAAAGALAVVSTVLVRRRVGQRAPMNGSGAEEILLGEALYRTEAHLIACCELYGIGRTPDALLQAARPMTDVLPWLETEARSAGGALQALYSATAAFGAQVRSNVPSRRLRRALEPFVEARDQMLDAVLGPDWDRPDYRASVALALLASASSAYRRGVESETLGDYQSAYALVAVAQELFEAAGAGKIAALEQALGAIASVLPAVEPPDRLALPEDLDRLVASVAAAAEELGAKEASLTLQDSLRKVDRLLADVLTSYERGLGPLAARLAASLFVRSYDPIRRELAAQDPDAEARLTSLLGFELRTAINEAADPAWVRALATEAHDLLVDL